MRYYYKNTKANMPWVLLKCVVDALLSFARRVNKAPAIELLAQRLARVETYMEKRQKEVI